MYPDGYFFNYSWSCLFNSSVILQQMIEVRLLERFTEPLCVSLNDIKIRVRARIWKPPLGSRLLKAAAVGKNLLEWNFLKEMKTIHTCLRSMAGLSCKKTEMVELRRYAWLFSVKNFFVKYFCRHKISCKPAWNTRNLFKIFLDTQNIQQTCLKH